MSKLFFVCFACGAAAWTIGSHGGELCASKTASAILAAPSRELLPKPESRTDEAPPQDLQDFDARCKAPGVLVCQGFDSPLINIAAKWPGAGLYPGADRRIHGSFDRNQRASGGGSLRFEILTHTAGNAAGFWWQPFGRNFGEGTTFYVQFRERLSPEMLKNKWGDTTWKQIIFHNQSSTCSNVELTTAQHYDNGFPIMYTDCGARSISTNEGKPPFLLQQGDYNCWYAKYNAKDCFMYPSDQWITFYYKISIGHWGKPDSAIHAWAGLDGKPLRQWIKMPNFNLKNDHPGQDYDCLSLLTYMTNKDANLDHPTAYAWYDELIVSTQPIAAPTPAVVP